ncbi:MAG: hypothetical protein AAF432_08090 [Planctomycetota bacterium]
MSDPQDQLELSWRPRPAGSRDDAQTRPRRFLSIWFRCCHVYGRIYRNSTGTRYEGRCPRCGSHVDAGIGPNGSATRMFEAR